MIRVTSDGANKIVRKLEQDKVILRDKIDRLSTFVAAVTENIEEVRPEFDFMKTIEEIEEIEYKIMKIKHAKTKFNVETTMSNGYTVGENLVRMAELNTMKNTYERLATAQPKTRMRATGNKDIEYQYTNYKIADARKKFEEVRDEIAEIQKEINIINTSEKYMIDISIDM